jgi:hypothetical protein
MQTSALTLYAVLSLSPDVSEVLIDARYEHMHQILDQRISAELKNRAQGNSSMLSRYRRMRELLEDVFAIIGNPERRDYYDDHMFEDTGLPSGVAWEAFNLFYGSHFEDFNNIRMQGAETGVPFILTQNEQSIVLNLYRQHAGSLKLIGVVIPEFQLPVVRQAYELYLASMIAAGCIMDEKKFWKYTEVVSRPVALLNLDDGAVEEVTNGDVAESDEPKKKKRKHAHK